MCLLAERGQSIDVRRRLLHAAELASVILIVSRPAVLCQRHRQFGDDRRSPMELIEEFLYRVKTSGPLKTTKGSPDGERNYWIVSEAELDGPKIKARIAAPGSDWMRVSDDGFWRPDVRAPFQTDDGETVLMHCTGLVQQTDAFKQAAESNQPTDWSDQYMRLTIRFDAGAERYRWLNTSMFIAKGRLLGTCRIEYAVYRIT
jgi:Protein of unknown function (DUF3237)